ncbi:hypothetical protein J2Z50_003180 [Ensifer mexicanus]|uniref:Uncharacterized protein n=1 Tax=Sinorhizobium mexicanum TaxID=375549 RepID=A0A859QVN6_9HYPH|nr:hypothetical protein [Sinorhizobium mexicanum]QLL64536.1 hypothetical protein FKV68_24330 [Sinorhizobium mexicanum]
MSKDENTSEGLGNAERQLYRVHLPGFVTEEEVGLGDVVRRVTRNFGINPCGGCEHRASVLNRWLVFTGRVSGK